MKWKTLEYDPKNVKGQIVLHEGIYEFGDVVKVPEDVILYGAIITRGDRAQIKKIKDSKIKKILKKLGLILDRGYILSGFDIRCPRCKTRVNVKFLPLAWAEVKLDDGVWRIPIRFKILVFQVFEPKSKLVYTLEPKRGQGVKP